MKLIIALSSITMMLVRGFSISTIKSSQARKFMISMSVAKNAMYEKLLKTCCYCLSINLLFRDISIVQMIAKCTGVSLIALSLTDFSSLPVPLLSSVSIVQPAIADVRAQQKRTYFRFAPKVCFGIFCEYRFNRIIYFV